MGKRRRRRRDNKQEHYSNLAWELRNGGNATVSSVKVTENTALNLVAVYAAVRVLAEDTSSLPFPVYRRLETGGKVRDREHPVFSLLNESPDGERTAMQWREALMKSVLLWGNGFSEIERSKDGIPLALHFIAPERVQPKRIDSRLFYEVEGASRPIPAADMIHVAGLGDGIVGLSPVRYAAQTIGAGLMMDQFASAWFANGSRGSGVIKHPGTLSEEALKHLRDSLRDVHGGPANFGKWMILEEGADIQQISIPAEDAQFLASRVFTVQEIARLFRIPCTLLQENSRSTFSNSEQEALSYVKHSLRPWLVRIEQQFNMKLFGREERRTWFAEHLVDGILRGDALSRTQALKEQWLNGALTIEEWREIENRNPVADPDEHFVPLNMTTLGAIRRAAQQPDPPADPQPSNDAATGPVGEPDRSDDRTTERPIAAHHGPQTAMNAARDALADAVDRMTRREVNALRRASRRPDQFFQWLDEFYEKHKQLVAKAVMPNIRAYLALTDPDADVSKLVEEWTEEICQEGYTHLLELSGMVTADEFESVMTRQAEEWERSRTQDTLAKLAV